MDQTGAVEVHQPRFPLAPIRERGGPLACSIERVNTGEAGDDAAIDETGQHRRHLPGERLQHAFVEQRHPPLDLARAEERPSLQAAAEDGEVVVAGAIADGCRLRGHVVGGFVLPHELVTMGHRKQQIPLFGAFGRLLIDQTLRAREPGARPPRLAQKHQSKADPERRARRPLRLPPCEACPVDALEGLEKLVVSPADLRRLRQPLEIVGAERRGRVAGGERSVRLLPGAPRVGLAPALERRWWRRDRRHSVVATLPDVARFRKRG